MFLVMILMLVDISDAKGKGGGGSTGKGGAAAGDSTETSAEEKLDAYKKAHGGLTKKEFESVAGKPEDIAMVFLIPPAFLLILFLSFVIKQKATGQLPGDYNEGGEKDNLL